MAWKSPNDPLPITIASLPTTQKHFDWAAQCTCRTVHVDVGWTTKCMKKNHERVQDGWILASIEFFWQVYEPKWGCSPLFKQSNYCLICISNRIRKNMPTGFRLQPESRPSWRL